jgi:hypothetical protein
MFLRFILLAFVTPMKQQLRRSIHLRSLDRAFIYTQIGEGGSRFQSLDLSMIRPCFQGLQMYRKQSSIPDKNLVFWGYFFHFGG